MVVGLAQDRDLAELGHVALWYGKSGCNALWCGYYKRLMWFQRRKSASSTSASSSPVEPRIYLTLGCPGFLWGETSPAIRPAIHRLPDPFIIGISLTVRLVGIREPATSIWTEFSKTTGSDCAVNSAISVVPLRLALSLVKRGPDHSISSVAHTAPGGRIQAPEVFRRRIP